MYFQELKDKRRLEESKRARTKKSKLGNSRRQLTVDDYHSSTTNDESMAKAVCIKLPLGPTWRIWRETREKRSPLQRSRGKPNLPRKLQLGPRHPILMIKRFLSRPTFLEVKYLTSTGCHRRRSLATSSGTT